MADLHVGKLELDFPAIFKEISQKAEVLALCGDLTDHGKKDEMELLIKHLSVCSIPIVAVLGNHDYESGEETKLMDLLLENNIKVLNGESTEINNVGFAGIKGFAGGFDSYTLAPWGEKAIKDFVQESVNDSLQLEKALSEISVEKKVVIMHYAPISATIKGEALELYPYLGCSRFASPLHRYKPNIVFHGHAHHGTHKGITAQEDIPVYNVSINVVSKLKEKKPYAIIEV